MAIPQLKVAIYWRAALSEERPGRSYEYPEKFTSFFRSTYSGPAIYRWRIHPGPDGKREIVYVGEAENLLQRVQRVLTPPKDGKSRNTNFRLKQRFDEEAQNGKSVFLDIADFDPFEVNGALIARNSLDDKFKRCFLESLCLCTLELEGYELLNRRFEPVSKAEKRFRELSPAQKRKALEAIKTKSKQS